MRSSFVLQLLVLRKALSVCGTEDALVRRLEVSKAELRRWLAGKEVLPLAVFNRAMHLVNRAYREAGNDWSHARWLSFCARWLSLSKPLLHLPMRFAEILRIPCE